MTDQRQDQDRTIRVFVSSTFRDMQEDRDYLVKFVFPQLRKLCESRGVTWGEVDLRWGITEEEAAEGKVLPLCLEEIHRCQPYFIGLLGERYGWVPKPEEIQADLLEREAWLKDHLSHSVTELEIIHGVLREEQMHRRAFFYFRDPEYLADILEEKRHNFTTEDAESAEKLKKLKQRIRAARDEEVCQLRESYRDPQQLGEWILEDFTQLIEHVYPAGEQPDELDREAAGHEAFARSRAGVYIGRQEYFDRLDAHVAGNGPPLVVLGESGLGKSALLANWFLSRFRDSTLNSQPSTTFALIHFIGSTADSADAARLMQRIMLELKRRFDLPDEVPVMPDKIREQFPQWLDKVAGVGRIVLVLDALNQIEDRDAALDLGWLPKVLPPNCRVIVSTLPGRSLEAVRRREWPEMTVAPLTTQEREQLIVKFLAGFSRRLSPSRVERIAQVEQTANPLFLRAMLDELRQFGEHERLDERIEHYLAAPDPQALYQRIVERWESDYGGNLVRQSLSFLWAARHGLSESELLEALGQSEVGDYYRCVLPDYTAGPLPHAIWTPFHLAAESSLTQRSGLLTFAHDFLRTAVVDEFLPAESDQHAAHRRLAEHFQGQTAWTERRLEELPWQLMHAFLWDRLSWLFRDVEFFDSLWDHSQYDVLRYWTQLEAGSQHRTTEFVAAFWELPQIGNGTLFRSAELLMKQRHYALALPAFEQLEKSFHARKDMGNAQAAAGNQGICLVCLNQLDAALAAFRRQQQMAEAAGHKFGRANALTAIAGTLAQQGKSQEAQAALEHVRANQLHNETASANYGIAGVEAAVMLKTGDFEAALEHFNELARTARAQGDMGAVVSALGNASIAAHNLGRHADSLAAARQQADFARTMGDDQEVLRALASQSAAAKKIGDYHMAIDLHQQQEILCRKLGEWKQLVISLTSRALLLFQVERNPEEPLRLLRDASAIAVGVGPDMEQAVHNARASIRRLSESI